MNVKGNVEPAMMQTAAGFPLIEDIDAEFEFELFEKEVLRTLAKEVARLSETEENKKKAQKWKKLNDLQSYEPVVFADPENGWNEIILMSDLECKNQLARVWEMYLRKLIYWATVMKDDKIIEKYFDVPYCYSETGWGLEIKKEGGNDGGAFHIIPPVKEYETDFDKLKFPEIVIDYAASEDMLTLAKEVFGGILEVRRKTTWWWTLGMTWDFINLRGLDTFMMDLILYPEWVHKMMNFLTEGYLKRLDFLEENGLLNTNNEGSYVGSGGLGATSELPLPNEIKGYVTPMDMWGFAESQETVGVSPEMFAEFVLPYQMKILKRFGLNCYGCCEPINVRWKYVKTIPRLRRVSASPWANKAEMARELGRAYIISAKPSPTPLSRPELNEEEVRNEVREILLDTKGCNVELIMKDNHTLGKNPRNITRWVEIAREEIANVYGVSEEKEA
jgi:hypothetical protein